MNAYWKFSLLVNLGVTKETLKRISIHDKLKVAKLLATFIYYCAFSLESAKITAIVMMNKTY